MDTANDHLLQRADAALADARRLREELAEHVEAGRAETRRARQREIFQQSLPVTLAIALVVRDLP